METSGPKGDDNPRRQMIDAITTAIMNDDFDFFDAVILSQQQLSEVELAEYINLKRQRAEDPAEAERWKFGLDRYLHSLSGMEVSEGEVETLRKIMRSLGYDEIKHGTAKKPEQAEVNDVSDDDEHWQDSRFVHEYTNEELEDLQKLPAFHQVEIYAAAGETYLNTALKVIEKIRGARGLTARKVLDSYVFQHAETYASAGETFLGNALAVINKYGSDEKAKLAMRRSIDKHVYAHAMAFAMAGGSYLPRAEIIVNKYASSEQRRDAMLRELGLI